MKTKFLKRMTAYLVTSSMLFSLVPVVMAEEDETVELNGVYYNGSAVMGCADDVTSITIVSEVNGTKITYINQKAFQNKDKLETVIIENGITRLGNDSFSKCDNLKTVSLPNSVTDISLRSFSECTSLEYITLPENLVLLGGKTFSGCSLLKEVTIPSTVTSSSGGSTPADGRWFEGCTSLEKVTFKDGITTVPSYAFVNCPEIEIILPDTITSVGESAFNNVKWIDSLEFLPRNVTSIGGYAFLGCTGLTDIDELPNTVTSIGSFAFLGCTSLKSANLPKSIVTTQARIFSGCSALESVSLPEGLIQLGGLAFENCSLLKEITIPSTVTSSAGGSTPADGRWFSGCSSLKKVTFKDGITSVPSYAFVNCPEIEIILPESITSVAEHAFHGVTWLDSLEFLPRNVTSIGGYAFSGCTGLTDIDKLPNTVTSIGASAFSGCTSLKSANLPKSIVTAQLRIFSGCSALESVSLPEGLIQLGGFAFENCSLLKEITIPSTVTSSAGGSTPADGRWFTGCSSLEKVTFKDGITSVPSYAFVNCPEIEIILPESITSVAEHAFHGVTWLDSLEFLPRNVTSIGGYAFSGCTSLTDIDELPDTVTSIGASAFSGCTSLKSANLPKTIVTAQLRIFSGCSSLENVFLPEGLIQLGGLAFENCSLLKEITIPSTVTSSTGGSTPADGRWFTGCSSLEKVTFSDGATIIPPYAFVNSQKIEIILPDTITSVGESAFNNVKWIDSFDFLPEKVENIERHAFYNCTGLKTLDTLPDSIKNIYFGAFTKCTELVSAEMPESLIFIGENAFSECTSLKSALFNEQLKTISKGAFSDCTSLESVYIQPELKNIGSTAFDGCPLTLVSYCGENKSAASIIATRDIYHVYTGDWNYNTLDKNNTYFIADTNTMLSYGYVTLIAKYDINETATGAPSNISMNFSIPRDCRYIEGSACINKEPIENVNLNSNMLTVSGLPANGVVSIRVSKNGARDVISRAQLQFDAKLKRYTETIGTISTQVRTISLITEPYFNGESATVTGIATPDSDISLYVNEEFAVAAKSNKAGMYSAQVPIPNPVFGESYTIKAVINSDEETSTEATTVYDPDKPVLKSFVLYPNNHIIPGEAFDLTLPGVIHNVDFWPGSRYIFKAEYTNPELIENVYITSIKGNDRRTIVAKYNEETGLFESYDYFDPKNANYVPGDIEIGYSLKYSQKQFDENSEKFKEDVASKADEFKELYDVEEIIEERIEEEKLQQYVFNLTDRKTGEVVRMTTKSEYRPDFDITQAIENGYISYYNRLIKIEEDAKNILISFYDCVKSTLVVIAVLNTFSESNNIGYLSIFNNSVSMIEDTLSIKELYNNIKSSDVENKDELITLLNTITVGIGVCYVACISFTVLGMTVATGGSAAVFALLYGLLFTEILGEFRYMLGLGESNLRTLLNWRLDPSGYVYEGVTSNRLENVTATVYYRDEETNQAVFWDAEPYAQKNPLLTSADGRYSWMVPEGMWQVKYELDGYETAYSDWLPVPPPQMDVNIGMISLARPELKSIQAANDEIKVIFSQYMQPDTINSISVSDSDGNSLSYTLEYPQDESDIDKNILARTYILKFEEAFEENTTLTLTVPDSVKSYANASPESKNYTITFGAELCKVTVPEAVEMTLNSETRVKIKVYGFGENDTITAKSNVERAVSVEKIEGSPAEGAFYVTLKANDLGSAIITLTLPNSEKVTFEAVSLASSDKEISVNNVVSDETGTNVTLINNTKDSISGILVLAKYDKDGRLTGVTSEEFDSSDKEFSVILENTTLDNIHYSIMVLNSLSMLMPLSRKY